MPLHLKTADGDLRLIAEPSLLTRCTWLLHAIYLAALVKMVQFLPKHVKICIPPLSTPILEWPAKEKDAFCSYAIYYRMIFTFTFMHLADAFIQSDLHYIQAIHCFVSMFQTLCPWLAQKLWTQMGSSLLDGWKLAWGRPSRFPRGAEDGDFRRTEKGGNYSNSWLCKASKCDHIRQKFLSTNSWC